MSKKTHEKQLARARAKRRVVVYKRSRRSLVLKLLAVVGVVALGGVAFFWLRGDGTDPIAVETPTDPLATFDTPDPTDAVEPPVACEGERPAAADEPKETYDALPEMTIDPAKTYVATVETSCGTISFELFDDQAPQTSNSFVFLAREGFYDGQIFHRVIDGFMVQGGDPTGTGSGGPGYSLPGEVAASQEHGFPRGTVAMANSTGPESAGSQFFIVQGDASHLGRDAYAAFGEVVEGIEVADAITAIPVDPGDRPTQTVFIEQVTIEERA